MEYNKAHGHSVHSFSGRLHHGGDSRRHLNLPSQEDLDQTTAADFQPHRQPPSPPSSYLPPYSSRTPPRTPLTRPTPELVDDLSAAPGSARPSASTYLILPGILVCLPMTLLVGMLLALIYVYRLRSQPDVFNQSWLHPEMYDADYILVDYPATRLVFAASFLSTVAPLLISFVMTLWTIVVSARMRLASLNQKFDNLPTPYQLSVLIGLCLASYEQLRLHLCHVSSRKRRTHLPPILKTSAAVFIVAFGLSLLIFVTDTVLHYTTTTVEYDRIHNTANSTEEFGHGVSPTCLNLDRVRTNMGFPCSMDSPNWTDPGRNAKRIEITKLLGNKSTESQIAFAPISKLSGGDMALLLPPSSLLDPAVDYRASTIGIQAQCRLLNRRQCNMKIINEMNHVQFNCSSNFYGVLGLPPVSSPANGIRVYDPNLSPLSIKTHQHFQYTFTRDADLTNLYNPHGYNTTTGRVNVAPEPDSELMNPLYWGFASTASYNSFVPGNPIRNDSRILNDSPQIMGMIMSCAIASYDVEYTWYRGNIRDVEYQLTANGSVLDIFHGAINYFPLAGGGTDMVQFQTEAGAAGNTTESYLHSWANSWALKTMANIGPWMSSRGTEQEQFREHLLVARIHKGALGSLAGLSLMYTVLGVVLVIAAYRACSQDVKIIADRLSLAGLTDAAFNNTRAMAPVSVSPATAPKECFDSENDHGRRVRVSGTEFRVWV